VTSVRRLARAAAVFAGIPALATAVVMAQPALPALAASTEHPDIGENAGPGLTVVQTLSLFVLIPLGVVALVYILVFALSSRGQRYRAGVAWQGPPAWWGGPAVDNPASVESLTESAVPLEGAGGARAHW
jgi:hypothetical protein